MKKLRMALRLRFPKFMANIVKILLYRKEEKLACLLTAYYEICVDKYMLSSAIELGHFKWINFLYCFDKNYLGVRRFKVEADRNTDSPD